jgi:hypothetical protein
VLLQPLGHLLRIQVLFYLALAQCLAKAAQNTGRRTAKQADISLQTLAAQGI